MLVVVVAHTILHPTLAPESIRKGLRIGPVVTIPFERELSHSNIMVLSFLKSVFTVGAMYNG